MRAVVSHGSAADLYELPRLDGDDRTHLTVGPRDSNRPIDGAVVHRSVVQARDVAVVRGVAATSPLRTVVDLARSRPVREVVVLVDAGLRLRYFSMAQLRGAIEAMRGAGRAVLREAAELADPRAGSAFESLMRVALVKARLGPVACQAQFDVDGHPYDIVLPWARVLVECDGWEHHRSRPVFIADRGQGNAVTRVRGWRLVRLVWSQAWPDPASGVAAVRAAVEASTGARARQRRYRASLNRTPDEYGTVLIDPSD